MDVATGAVIIAGLRYAGPEGAKLLADFAQKLFGPSALALGEAMASPIVDWQKRRARNAAALMEAAANQAADIGAEPKAVAGPVLVPLLEKGSLEDHEEMRTRWASLLAHAATSEDGIPPGFVSILADLSPFEARMADFAYAGHVASFHSEIALHALFQEMRVEEDVGTVAVENIERLGLWRRRAPTIASRDIVEIAEDANSRVREIAISKGYAWHKPDDIELDDDTGRYKFTMLGRAFMEACQPLRAPSEES